MRTVLLLLVALPLFGQNEICRFRAGDREDPFRRWLASQELTCVDAATAPAFPPGLWNVFVRGERMSSPVIAEGGTAPFALSTFPAATLTLRLPDQHGGVVYVPRRASAYPVSGARTLVPAGDDVWLFVLDGSRSIASIVPIAALEEGAERTVDARTGALPPSVLGWVRVEDADREAILKATDVAAPPVSIAALVSDPLPPLAVLDGAFVLVRGVAAGDGDLVIGGRGWLPHRTRVRIGSRAVTVAKDPLFARPAASLIVNWSAMENVPELEAALGSCDPSKDPPPRYQISVSACATPKTGMEPPDPATCKLVRQETFGAEVPFGSFVVEDLVPGTYRGEIRFGKLPPVSVSTRAVALQQRPLRVAAWYDTVYGSVTHGGEPLQHDATLKFPDGGVGFWSHEEDEYLGVLREPIEEDDRIDIEACEGGLRAFVITDKRSKRMTRLDLDIPDNSIAIDVSDTFTRMRLRAATVKYVVLSELFPFRPLVTQTLTPDDGVDDGHFVIKGVPERQVRLTVTHAGYQKQEVPQFTIAKSEARKLDVQLVPLRGSHGRILSPVPFEDGVVMWMSAAGDQTERADLAPDGTFVYENAHEAGETMAIVSSTHPLWVLRTPAVAQRQTLQLTFPDAPLRDFTVSLQGDPDRRVGRYVGIVIGGILVPQSALRVHQELHEEESLVRGDRAMMKLRRIAETGPIDVILGPTVNEIPSRGRVFDPLLLPRSDEPPRQRLAPGMTEIVFTLK